MAAFSSVQAGDWTTVATWGAGTYPQSGDTATTNHAIAGNDHVTVDVLIMEAGGHVTMAAGKQFTARGSVWQKDATFTGGDGAEIIGDTTLGSVKWLHGSANSQTACKIVMNGTSGSHCKIRKTGSGSFWFDGGEEGAESPTWGNCGGWDCTYTDFSGLGHNSLAWSIRSNDFGMHHRRFNHCTFDNCKTQFAVTYQWNANGDADWKVQHCRWMNQPAAAVGMRYYFGFTGTGVLTFDHNVVDEPADNGPCMTLTPTGATVDDNFFDSCPAMGGAVYASFLRNVVRAGSNTQTIGPTNGLIGNYLLYDHVDPADRVLGLTNVGNPHFLTASGVGTYSDNVGEYPHELNIDGGEVFYGGSLGASTIRNNLVLPSMTDGIKSGDLLNPGNLTNWEVDVHHNTVLGKQVALAFLGENVVGHTCILKCKSNIIEGEVGGDVPESCAGAYDIALDPTDIDVLDPTQIQYNYLHNYRPFTDSGGGGAWTNSPHDGWRCHLTSVPDATNIYVNGGTGPAFVDNTRCAARWAVYKGAVSAEPSKPALPVNHGNGAWITWLTWKRDALDAVRTLLKGDPTLGSTDLMVWVKAGYAPTNAVLQDAGHDGATIGAIEFEGGGPPPPPATNFFRALGR